ncbi:MAG: ThiF family adenylyltransferase [Candidatus Nanohalobium sp.]
MEEVYSRLRATDLSEQQIKSLQRSKVAVIGLGATGSVIAESLARYGVKLKIIDRDYLEPNDLYSSSIYTLEDVEKSLPKAKAASKKLGEITEVEERVESLRPGNISTLLEDIDLIIDGTDNLETRLLINEYCQREGKPWIYTAALADQGYSMLLKDKCFNCIFRQVKPEKLGTCRSEGIERDIAAMAAHRSSYKAFKHLTGREVEQDLHILPEAEAFKVECKGCKICKEEEYEYLGTSKQVSSVCGEDKYRITIDASDEVIKKFEEEAEELKASNSYLVRGCVDGREIVVYRSGEILVEAENSGHAEAVLSEVLGI